MNNKDKEGFEKWLKDYFGEDATIVNTPKYFNHSWQAACDFKQKEIDELLDNEEALRDHMNSIGYIELKKLQAENAKLKYCLKEIANEDYRGNRSNASVKAYRCLKELDENL